MKIQVCFFVLLNLISNISFAETSIPINQIVELDEFDYLVSMIKDKANSIGYRTYPFAGIDAPGFYKLANNVSNQISINVNDVILDMGGHTVSGGLVIGNNLENITVKNGTVDVNSALANAIIINSGCKNIKLDRIAARNATTNGININGLRDSIIKNCEMTQNATGLLLCNSSNIMVDDTISSRNLTEGFCLVSSVTCSFRRCKAINTGLGNANSTADIIGIVTDGGFGNAFENCIVNGTQGNLVTDSESTVAGICFKNGESCSRIIGCEVGNSHAALLGNTIPYGILLDPTLDATLTLTAVPPIPDLTGSIRACWTPDGQYLGVTTSNDQFFIYQFDRKNLTLTKVAEPRVGDEPETGALIRGSCSSDGRFFTTCAFGTSTNNALYEFERANNTLTKIPFPGFTRCQAIEFSPDMQFIATNEGFGTTSMCLYSFNRITRKITLEDSVSGVAPRDIRWSPDGNFITQGNQPRIIPINRDSKTFGIPILPNVSSGTTLATAWSPDGRYIAAKSNSSNLLTVYEFDNRDRTLTRVATAGVAGVDIYMINWSSDGRFITLGLTSGVGVRVYEFRNGNTLTLRASNNVDFIGTVACALFSPDGEFIVVGAGGGQLRMYRAFNFPKNNVIKNNTVYCNTGNDGPGGIGISGSSASNMIIQNTCYANPVMQAGQNRGLSMKSINFAFIPNVFNPLFQDVPTAEQNIGPSQYDPICAPPDQVLMLTQLNSKLCDIQTKIDLIIAANP